MTIEEEKKKEEEKKSGTSGIVIFGAIFGSLAIVLTVIFAFLLIRKLMKKDDPNKPARFSLQGMIRHKEKPISLL